MRDIYKKVFTWVICCDNNFSGLFAFFSFLCFQLVFFLGKISMASYFTNNFYLYFILGSICRINCLDSYASK